MSKKKEFFISGLSVSLAIAIGRAFGFLREILLAAVFGKTYEADIATLSLMIPDIMVNIILGGAFSAAFMSTFVKSSDQENFNLILYLHYTLGGLFLGVAIIFFIYASEISYMIAPNIPFVAQQELELLLKITCWSIPFIVCSCIVTASLNAKGIFFLPALGTAVINLTICFSILISLLVGKKLLLLVAVSVVIGSILRWFSQIFPVILKNPFNNIYSFNTNINKFSIFSRYGQVFLATSSMMAIPVFARFYMIKTGAGQLANLNYTQKLMDLLITFIVGSVITVILPNLSKAQNNIRTICFFIFIMFPLFVVIAIVFFYISPLIANLFFGYGAFNKSAIDFLVLHMKEAAFVLPPYSIVFFLTGSLSVTGLSYKNALACFVGLGIFLILILIRNNVLTYSAVYQSMAVAYGVIFLIQILFIFFHERQYYAKTYVYN